MIELRCSAALALRLGAFVPETPKQHRELRDAGLLLIRDPVTACPLFWPWATNVADELRSRSS